MYGIQSRNSDYLSVAIWFEPQFHIFEIALLDRGKNSTFISGKLRIAQLLL